MILSPLLAMRAIASAEPAATTAQHEGRADRADRPATPPVRILFLGDRGHHQPALRAAMIEPVLARRGIRLTYTENVGDLALATLRQYDGLLIYANIDHIEEPQLQALLQYVRSGGGLIAVHCASYCFRNAPEYVRLVGAQFLRHGTGTFRTEIVAPDHPLMRGFGGFESWDETYIHTRHNSEGRTVLSVRRSGEQAEGRDAEPWTWVRTEGRGRVFYTAWGHDHRTWAHPGFHNLLERGIRWATGRDPSVVAPYPPRDQRRNPFRQPFEPPPMKPLPKGLKPFTYRPARIPFYPPGRASRGDGQWNRMQNPLPPEESIRHFVTPVGFDVELFVSEPQLQGKPICMTWDERGRLWVAETVDYPNDKQPDGQGHDRIRICEDTDGDGRADRFVVFADGLSIPTGMAFAFGGLVVHQPPHTLFLKDTDGDDRADIRRVLFTGWSTADTHAGPSNLHYGPDNWFWGVQGYAGFKGSIAGRRESFGMGFYRFRLAVPPGSDPLAPDTVPEVVDFEFIRSTDNNTWGLGFSEEGLVFGSTANRNPSVFMPIPNRYYERVRGWSAARLGTIADSHLFHPITDRVRQVDHHGGFTAAAGHALYTARRYPRSFWNRTAFVCGPTGHLVGTFVLRQQGADFRSRYTFNLLASDDEWSAPTMAEIGPDGNVWVIDWYNYIVQHNPTPAGFKTGKGNAYETPLRDKTHGRIYRVVYGDETPSHPALDPRDPHALVAALRHPNLFWRRHAQRLLVERGRQDVIDDLLGLVADQSVDAIGLNVGAMHALWTLAGLNALQAPDGAARAAAVAALRHPSAGVRRAALTVLPRDAQTIQAILDSRVLHDVEPQVRLAALLALADAPASAAAGRALADVLRDPIVLYDRWLLDAATSAAAAHDRFFLPALAAACAEKPHPPLPPLLERVRIVAAHFARRSPADSDVAAVLRVLPATRVELAAAVLQAWAEHWPDGAAPRLSKPAVAAFEALFPKLGSEDQSRLLQLGRKWRLETLNRFAAEVAARLWARLRDTDRPLDARVQAARQWLALQPEPRRAAARLLDEIGPRTPPQLASELLRIAGSVDSAEVARAIIERLSALTPTVRSAALAVLLARPAATRELLAAAESGTASLADLRLDQRQALLAHPDPEIARRAKALLEKGGGLPNPDRQRVIKQFLPITRQHGDPRRGKQTFLKVCAKCHTHSGEGTRIGPDLTGMAVHPKVELLTQILDPSRSVEGNYRAYSVVTEDGRVLTGLLASETRTTIELIDTEAKRHVIERDRIELLKVSDKSIMPEGFEKQLSADELRDLLEFLTHRGRFVPLDVAKAATIVSTEPMFYGVDRVETLVFPDWKPKTVGGVPFWLVDPRGNRVPNAIMLYGPLGKYPPRMPRTVSLPLNAPAVALHFLSGVGGWAAKQPLAKPTVCLIVRLHYADGRTEDHPLLNGRHFADYIGPFDVPDSKRAFNLGGRQIRYFAIRPKRRAVIERVELVKGPDHTAPIVMAITAELPAREESGR
ncbi:MAG: glycosyl hydrolase [Planctomycetota bacterium]|nr:MAG: glycosyl hydrolase [Planctomycetota bacterium]